MKGGTRLLLWYPLARSSTTENTTGTTGGDETDLLTGRRISRHCCGVADVLLVTTTVGVLNGVHSNTTYMRPAVALSFVFVMRTASFEHGLIDTTAASNDTNCSTAF